MGWLALDAEAHDLEIRMQRVLETLVPSLLAETGVAATPGFDFDRGRGHYFMRFSFAGATDRMIEAAKRLKAWGK